MSRYYVFTFDLDTTAMRAVGYSDSYITRLYKETAEALARSGITRHPEGSVYYAKSRQDRSAMLSSLCLFLKETVPAFCQFVKSAHLFKRTTAAMLRIYLRD
jgi:virulence-associated protein VapD